MKKRSQGDIFSIYNSLMGGNEVKLFSVVPTDRKRGNGYKYIKFYLIARKLFFFTMTLIKTGADCPECVYSPICGDIENPAGYPVLDNLL